MSAPEMIVTADVSEKKTILHDVEPVSPTEADVSSSRQSIVKDWDDKEEKTDLVVIPALALAFFALQLDRGNISTVLTSTFLEDLQLTTDQVNIGSQLFSIGVVLSELPSNIILQKFNPRIWLGGQLFVWGLVATFQAFIGSYPSYLATRFILGFCEGGFVPGALYYMSTWYKRSETSVRVTMFYLGQLFSSATTTLISAGLLDLHGTGGLQGWQWIFLVEGLLTIAVSVIFVAFIPPTTGDGRALIFCGRGSFFTERQSHIIVNRVLLDDPQKAMGRIGISGRDLLDAVKNPRIVQHVLITLVGMTGFYALGQYTPSMIHGLGFSAIDSSLLASVPVYCCVLWTLVLAYIGDRTNHRGPVVFASVTYNVITYTVLAAMPEAWSKWQKYVVIAFSNVSYSSLQILNISWVSVYCTTPQQRSIAMAFTSMAANCAGLSGSQIFRTNDAPMYQTARIILSAMAAGSWVLVVALGLQYYLRRKTIAKAM